MAKAKEQEKEFITDDVRAALREAFKELDNDVPVEVYTQEGSNDMFNEFAVTLTKAVSEASDKIKVTYHKIGDENSIRREVKRSPTILIAPDRYDIRYTGAPAGEEGRSFVMSIIMASTGKTLLSDDARKRLERLKDKRHVRVFVSPT